MIFITSERAYAISS